MSQWLSGVTFQKYLFQIRFLIPELSEPGVGLRKEFKNPDSDNKKTLQHSDNKSLKLVMERQGEESRGTSEMFRTGLSHLLIVIGQWSGSVRAQCACPELNPPHSQAVSAHGRFSTAQANELA